MNIRKFLLATSISVCLLFSSQVMAKESYKHSIHVKVIKQGINSEGTPYIITTDIKKDCNWYLELTGKQNKSYNSRYKVGDSVHIKYNTDEEFIFGKDKK